jgi:hypothetical protein
VYVGNVGPRSKLIWRLRTWLIVAKRIALMNCGHSSFIKNVRGAQASCSPDVHVSHVEYRFMSTRMAVSITCEPGSLPN